MSDALEDAGLAPAGLVCPRCRGALSATAGRWSCSSCVHRYEQGQAGIPDLRLFDDPFLGRERDRERTELVLNALGQLELEPLLRLYWSFSVETPPELRERFVAGALLGEEKGRRLLALASDDGTLAGRRVLDVGSGTGGLLLAAARMSAEVVGLDIAMRWLHLSRRRFLDAGRPPPGLVCGCAEYLPFDRGSFDMVAIAATLEFCQDPGRVLAEAARVLAPGGCVIVNTVNRYSLGPQPHVRLMGVGFLPRAWQGAYVGWRRGVALDNIRPLSYRALMRSTSPHFSRRRLTPADVPSALLERLPGRTAALVRIYQRLTRTRVGAALLALVGPEWDLVLRP